MFSFSQYMKIKNYFFQIVNRIVFFAIAIPSALGFIPALIYVQNFERPSWSLFFAAIFFSLLTHFWRKKVLKADLTSFKKGLIEEDFDFNSWETPFWKIIPTAIFFTLFWISVSTWLHLLGGGSAPDSNYPLG